LSKEERARIAIEKRAQEVEARRAAEKAKNDAVRQLHSTNGSFARDNGFQKEYVPTGPRTTGVRNGGQVDRYSNPRFSDSQRNSHTSNQRRDTPESREEPRPPKRDRDEPVVDGEELATMRARYMGIAPEKTKKRRINDRKFVFDWSTDADTTTSYVDSAKPVNVAFGRGHLGGLDSGTDRRGGLDRHWTEKELIEMTERDWRIFREDFSISTKGTNNFCF
jgi:ATP-dependent RNA helicase DDX23/PRP28